MARTKQTARRSTGGGPVNTSQPLSGCWFPFSKPDAAFHIQRSYLPLTGLKIHTTIMSTVSRTTMTQTFMNDSDKDLEEIIYSFPLYHGIVVVSFIATVGDIKIVGAVKEKQEARQKYRESAKRGEVAGLLEQLPEASDVFTVKIGNVPASKTVVVELVYIGELKHDAEVDGIRFTVPATVAPRYGSTPHDILSSSLLSSHVTEGIKFTVDINGEDGSHISLVRSPSHPILFTIGCTSDMVGGTFDSGRASATLSLNTTVLDKDFVVLILAKDVNIPRALLETHPTISNQRALMTTLIPKFRLPSALGEIVFIVDRSGSMAGKIDMVIKAMTVMLKSLPVGVKFNICSFGSEHSFLWERSKSYEASNLAEALEYVDRFDSNFGGTEILAPIEATVEARYRDLHLDVILLTDGQVWDQLDIFDYISKSSKEHSCRFFSLGIGGGVSTALVEGIAEAGDGFCQFVSEDEKIDRKMVRLLKGALSPRIRDYTLEVVYSTDVEYVMVESVQDASQVEIELPIRESRTSSKSTPISLFDPTYNPNDDDDVDDGDKHSHKSMADILGSKYAHLPKVTVPSIIQVPTKMPTLYPFTRTNVYLLLGPSTYQRQPKSVILRGTSEHGPLELEINIQDIGNGQTIHQLAAKKAVHELEQGQGWLAHARNKNDKSLLRNSNNLDSQWNDLVEREAVRLGVEYQVGGKYCSFVAVQDDGVDNHEEEEVVFGGKIPLAPPGGAAPRRQLASKACRKSASSTGMSSPPQRKLREERHKGSITEASMMSIDCMDLDCEEDETPKQELDTVEKRIHALVKLQTFEGTWDWSEELLNILHIGELSTLVAYGENTVHATALALAFFQLHEDGNDGAWELIIDKGKDWLDQQLGIEAEKEIGAANGILLQAVQD